MKRGIFAVVKPVGITSAAVINRIKTVLLDEAGKSGPRTNIQLKVGHGGTLDRAASGVLVVAIGNDCKQLCKFLTSDKSYECVGKLGEATDTWDMDIDSTVVQKAPWKHIQQAHISDVLQNHFLGEIYQIPPKYSALKLNGRRASDLAREGIDFTLQPRRITVHSIQLIKFQPPYFTLTVHCTSGTYIRSIVHELGQHLGSTACVNKLCRTRQGVFTLNHALHLQDWTYEKIKNSIENSSKLLDSQLQ